MYAQTNLQLHAQLLELDYPVSDQEYLAAAYRLAADLFSGQYRGSGKPFLAHLVGTASILGSTKAPATVMAAGMLHAAYDQGDFGFGLRGRHANKREELKKVLGAAAEDYVHRYFKLRWNNDTVASLPAKIATFAPADQNVVLIRLANELEDYLDSGVLFCANNSARLARLAGLSAHHITLARQLGQPGLADDLSQAFSQNLSGHVPSGVQGRSRSGHSFLQIPRSYGRRYAAIFRSYATVLQSFLERK